MALHVKEILYTLLEAFRFSACGLYCCSASAQCFYEAKLLQSVLAHATHYLSLLFYGLLVYLGPLGIAELLLNRVFG